MKHSKLKSIIAFATIITSFSAINPSTTYAAQWVLNGQDWSYKTYNGTVKGWQYIDGKWYYFNTKGIMSTGWLKYSDKWYYLDSSGAMVTGWQYIDQKWYLLDNNGAMITGWSKSNNIWYYLNNSGDMATGWVNDNNKWYFTNNSGAMITGTINVENKIYHLDNSGAMVTGRTIINGIEYEFNEHGEAIGETLPPATSIFNKNGINLNNNTSTSATVIENNPNANNIINTSNAEAANIDNSSNVSETSSSSGHSNKHSSHNHNSNNNTGQNNNQSETTEPGTTTNSGTTINPDVTTGPGATIDPGVTTDPDATTGPGATIDPDTTTDPDATINLSREECILLLNRLTVSLSEPADPEHPEYDIYNNCISTGSIENLEANYFYQYKLQSENNYTDVSPNSTSITELSPGIYNIRVSKNSIFNDDIPVGTICIKPKYYYNNTYKVSNNNELHLNPDSYGIPQSPSYIIREATDSNPIPEYSTNSNSNYTYSSNSVLSDYQSYVLNQFSQENINASVLNYDNTDKTDLETIIEKAIRSTTDAAVGPLKIGYIGGSITHGYSASIPADKVDPSDFPNSYATLSANWWKDTFGCDVKIENMGIPSCDSLLGAHRIDSQLLSDSENKPDLIVIEFDVNDGGNEVCSDAYDALIKKCLDSNVAVVLLCMTAKDDYKLFQEIPPTDPNCNNFHYKLGAKYNVPIVSYKAFLNDHYHSNYDNISWDILTADNVHPSNGGHRMVADLLTNYYQKVLTDYNLKNGLGNTTSTKSYPIVKVDFSDAKLCSFDYIKPDYITEISSDSEISSDDTNFHIYYKNLNTYKHEPNDNGRKHIESNLPYFGTESGHAYEITIDKNTIFSDENVTSTLIFKNVTCKQCILFTYVTKKFTQDDTVGAFQVFLDDNTEPISSKIINSNNSFIASQPQVVTIRSTNESITDDDLKLNSSYNHDNAFIFKTDEPSAHTITIKCYGDCNNLRFIGLGVSGLPEDFERTYLN